MTLDELKALKPGDSVLGAFGDDSEHIVDRVGPVRSYKRAGRKKAYSYRDAWLDDGVMFVRETRLREGGKEVLVACRKACQ